MSDFILMVPRNIPSRQTLRYRAVGANYATNNRNAELAAGKPGSDREWLICPTCERTAVPSARPVWSSDTRCSCSSRTARGCFFFGCAELPRHTGMVVKGRLATQMADGIEIEMGPGDAAIIPTGHDGWVVGDEPVTYFDIIRSEQ